MKKHGLLCNTCAVGACRTCVIMKGASIVCFLSSKVLNGLSPGAVQMRPPVVQQQLRPQAQQGMPAHRPAPQQPALLQSALAAPVS